LEKAISQSGYFFRDEAPAAMQWQLRPEEAQKLILPVLVVEGANRRAEGMLSQQVTEVAVRLFPSSELALIDGANHMVPLQQPHWAMQSPTSSSGTQWPAPPSRLVR
jgi:pimeloyl-ACP methyl ester carboxylesterase